MKTAECRSCGEAIVWTTTSAGKRMPVDAEPAPPLTSASLFRLVEDDDEVRAEFVPVAQRSREPELFVSHFATCPHADHHRRSR